jgi:prepilin-type N-terminal cleavage/methylation domain-containing protein
MKTLAGKLTLGKNHKGFTLVEVMVSIAIVGILAAISVPNFRMYMARAEYASMSATLKHLMDGEEFFFLAHDLFHPKNGNINIPSGTAKDIPELAYSFPKGHKNRYTIYGVNDANFNYYQIDVRCDFDSNNNGSNDRFIAITVITRSAVSLNRVVIQLQ